MSDIKVEIVKKFKNGNMIVNVSRVVTTQYKIIAEENTGFHDGFGVMRLDNVTDALYHDGCLNVDAMKEVMPE